MMNTKKSFLERNTHLQSLRDGSAVKINLNGQNNLKLVAVALSENILLTPDMYHVAGEDYIKHVDLQSATLDPNVGRHFNKTHSIFDTVGEHSKFRTYFIDPDLVSSMEPRYLTPPDSCELNHLLKDLMSGKRDLMDFRYWFNYITFRFPDPEVYIYLRYNCIEDTVSIRIVDSDYGMGHVTYSYDKDDYDELLFALEGSNPVVNINPETI